MPTIHRRFLLRLLLVVALVAGAIAGVHAIQAGRIPDALRRQAERAIAAEKPDAAIRFLRQYLEFRPTDADAQEQLANLLKARAGDSARSELVFLYDKILRNDPARLAVRREAVIACLQLRRFTDAAAHAEALLKERPEDADAWRYLARAQVGQRQFDAAKKSYEAAIERDPQAPIGYRQLAEFHWLDRDQPAEALAVFDRMVAALPRSGEAYHARAKFLAQSGGPGAILPPANDDPAIADWRKSLEMDPANAEAALLFGERLQRHRDLLGARAVFLEGLKHNPDDERLVRSLAWLETNRGNVPGAIRVLEEAVSRSKDGFELLVPLADLLMQSGDLERTRTAIAAIEKHRGTNAKLRAGYLRGRMAMHRANWDEAIAELTAVRGAAVELPALETQANVLLATCHARRGETAKAIECLQLVTLKEPANLAARVALATAHLDAGQSAEAVREYDLAANHSAATPAIVGTAVQLKALRLIVTAAGEDAWKDLERSTVGLANRLGNRTADGGLILADLAGIAGHPKLGIDILQKALARQANDGRVWTKLAELVADAHGVAAALRILDEAQGIVGDGAALRLARADLYVRDPARLRPLAPLESQIDAWSEDDQFRLLHGLVDAHDRIGDSANVLRLYRKIAARRPRDAAAWLAICERAWAAGDAATANEAAAMVQGLDAKPAEADALCVAWRELAAGGTPSVRATFGEKPNRADACRVLARAYEREGRADRAREMLARATRLEPMNFEAATALLAHLSVPGAEAELNRAIRTLAVDPRWAGEPFRRAVRAAAVSNKNPDPLLHAVRPIVERQPDGLGWFADLQAALGWSKESLATCQLAVSRPTATTDDWLRFSLRTAETSGRDAGAAIVQSAKSRLVPSAYADLAAAFTASRIGAGAVIAAGAPREIRLFAEARLAIRLAQLDRVAAIRECEAVLADARTPGEDAAWARRKLAMVLTVRGEPSDRKRALDLLVGERGGAPGDRRATASVLASLARHVDGADRAAANAAAIAILDGLAAEPSREQRQDSFAHAKLLQSAGRTEAAAQAIQTLLNADPNNVDYLLAALGILNAADRLDAAEPFATRLLAAAPNDHRAVAAVALFECRRGDATRAIALAEAYERTADLAAGEAEFKTARAAEMLDRLAREPGTAGTPAARRLVDAAVAKYESILHARPQHLADIATALAADGRGQPALDVVERLAKLVPERYRALAGLAALRAGRFEPARARSVRDWLAAAIAREPASLALRLAEAEFHLLTDDLAAAERGYETVLTADERNATALNNLAWILAPRPDATARAAALVERAARETGLTGELLDTRARIRIAARQPDLAERDAAEALRQEKTPLRYFHLALAQREREPRAGRSTFLEARRRGLDAKNVHPLDRDLLATFE
jgi:cellulose synthase operon protein C